MAATLQVGRPRRPQLSARPDASGADRPIQISTFSVLRRSALAGGFAIAVVIAAVLLAVRLVAFDDWAPPPSAALQQGQLAPAAVVIAPSAEAHAHAAAPARPRAPRTQTADRTEQPLPVREQVRGTPVAPAPEPPLAGVVTPGGAPAPDESDGSGLPAAEPSPADPVRDSTRIVEGALDDLTAPPLPS